MSYVFDSNTPVDERTRRRRLAEALMLKATDAGPIASPWQGAAKMAQALMGGIELGMYDKQDREDRDYQKSLSGELSGSGTPSTASPVAAALAKPPTFARTGGKMADVGDPVATDLNPQQMALLNAIAAPESAGRYNVRYTPNGGAPIDDLSQHPRIFEPTKDGQKSSAAGRYQFTATTWDGLGGGSFDPASQDKKAIELARRDYKARTGRDFDGDLAVSGMSPQIMQALAPTWHGLRDNPGRAMAAYNNSLKKYGAVTDVLAGGSGDATLSGDDLSNKPKPPAAGMMAVGSGQPPVASAAPAASGLSVQRLQQIAFDPRATEQQRQQARFMLQQMQKDDSVSTVDLGTSVGVMDKKGNVVRTIPKQPDAPANIKEFEYGQANPSYNEWAERQKRAGATSVNVGGGSDKQIFDSMLDEYKGIKAAVTGLNSIQEARKALNGGGIFGAGADFNLGLQKIGAALGVTDPTKIQNTETFRAAIAPQVASMLKSTVGTANISNTDREFAEKAAGGNITLDEGSIRRLLTIMDKAARAQIEDFNGRLNDVYPDSEDGKFKRERAIMRAPKVPDFIPDVVPGVVAPPPAGGGVPASVQAAQPAPQKVRRYNPKTQRFEDVAQ